MQKYYVRVVMCQKLRFEYKVDFILIKNSSPCKKCHQITNKHTHFKVI
jgi:hypothetical protein